LPILCVNQFAEHDLLRRIANVVHGSRRKPLTGEPHQPYNERRKGRCGKRLAQSVQIIYASIETVTGQGGGFCFLL
jgi:phage gpG-like protein